MITRGLTASLCLCGGLFTASAQFGIAQQFTISTQAGTVLVGYTGDGGPALSATMRPDCVTVDPAGNLYISDWVDNVVRKVDSNGNITTVAGSGSPGYTGDFGPATSATLNSPCGVAFDKNGDIFIADSGNDVIREVTPIGNIATIAGTNVRGYSGDGGAATSAQLYQPTSLAFDSSGNLYFTDSGNHVIRAISPGGIIFTFAGSVEPGYSGDGGPASAAQFYYPKGLAMDGGGNLYIADFGNSVIRKISGSGTITTVAGNGIAGYYGDGALATSAALAYPESIALDSSGDLFIADTCNQKIREVTPDGIIVTAAGNGTEGYAGDSGPAPQAELNYPGGIAIAGAKIFIADWDNNVVRMLAPFVSDTRNLRTRIP